MKLYTPDSGLTHLFHSHRRSGIAAYTVDPLVTIDCSRRVINPLYHCRHSARSRQCNHEI